MKYEDPKLEIVRFETDDVIATSPTKEDPAPPMLR